MSEDYTPSMKEIRADYVACNSSPQETVSNDGLITIWQARGHFDRLLAAHDAELREQIAREIEARKPRASKLSEYITGVRRGIYLAASIARGKTRASVELVERCGRCGCNLWYPTAAHVVDCGTRKEQEQ